MSTAETTLTLTPQRAALIIEALSRFPIAIADPRFRVLMELWTELHPKPAAPAGEPPCATPSV